MRRSAGALTAAALVGCFAFPVGAAERLVDRDGSTGGRRVAVTVTNVTRGQIFSPPIVVAHDSAVRLFEVGRAASPELAAVAEDAVAGPLLALLGTLPGVHDVRIADGVIPPGESRTVEVTIQGRFATISVVGMLVTTNDAFYAVSAPALPSRSRSTVMALAYDAGSEANSESCDHIPGPPCGNGGMRVPEGAEGFVHVHAGVQGSGDLVPSMHDWRNPVAYVSID